MSRSRFQPRAAVRLGATLLASLVLACGTEVPPRDPTYPDRNLSADRALLQGRVFAVNPLSARDQHQQLLHITLATEDGARFHVALGPGWYLKKNGMTFHQEDLLSVTPVEDLNQHHDPHITAASIETTQGKLILRDADGKPSWDGETPPPEPTPATTPPPTEPQ